MDKLTRYNQKILAILGTTTLVAVTLILLIAGGFWLDDMFQRPGPIVEEGLELLDQQDSTDKIRQQISFSMPQQLDTSKPVYLIPVGQKNLEYEMEELLDKNFRSSYWKSDYRSFSGLYNNFVLADYLSNDKRTIFKTKCAISSWSYLHTQHAEVLIFKGTRTDHNKDNLLNTRDYQSIFIYYLEDQTLKEYAFDHATVLDYEPVNGTPLVAVDLGLDGNKNIDFDNETHDIIGINLVTRNLDPIVPDSLKKEVQTLIGQ